MLPFHSSCFCSYGRYFNAGVSSIIIGNSLSAEICSDKFLNSSLFTFPILITLLEPLFLKVKFNPIYILFGLMVLTGLYIITPEFNIESSQVKGILFGILSAFCYSIRILILKQHVANYNGTMLMFYQTVITTVLLLPVLFIMDLSALKSQFPYLLLLALLTTAVGHSLMLHSLKFFSASTASIISSLQPVFGIILAFIFLSETPTTNTFFGGSLILLTVGEIELSLVGGYYL